MSPDISPPRPRISLLGAPYDASSSFRRGAADAPAAIRTALRTPASNAWSEGGLDTSLAGVLEDAGDVSIPDIGSPGDAIERATAELLEQDRIPLVLGGDHSITWPVLRALRPTHSTLTVLHFDAHPDLYDQLDGNRFSHASPFARIMEEKLADRLIQVGVRAINGHQREQAERFGVEQVEMRNWSSGAVPSIDGPVYISLDVDVLDPAFAPGVSHPEPGGMTTRELIGALQALGTTVVGADIVELNPQADVNGLTAVVCAKLLKELIDAVMRSHPATEQRLRHPGAMRL